MRTGSWGTGQEQCTPRHLLGADHVHNNAASLPGLHLTNESGGNRHCGAIVPQPQAFDMGVRRNALGLGC